jgi:superfamily II DNA/RNA helicase
MINAGIKAATIHGNKGQGARNKSISGFQRRKPHPLVATDIAARGLDIPLLPHVVNFLLIFLKITFTVLVEQEELEQVEKLFLYCR